MLAENRSSSLLVKINPDQYKVCVDASLNYWASSKKGAWGKGLVNSKEDKTKVERTGLLGEMAFYIISGLPYNFTFKKGGDKFDFQVNNKTIDVKTATYNYGCICIPAYNGSGNYVFRNHDFYVSAYIVEDNGKWAEVELVGWEFGTSVKQLPVKGARAKGLHKNYELEHKKVRPIEELIELLLLSPTNIF